MERALLAGLLLTLSACSGPDAGAPAADQVIGGPAPREASSAPTVADADLRPVRVPVLVGARLREVRGPLDDLGVEVVVRPRPACLPGVVLTQSPEPGTRVAVGARVELVVSRVPATATCIIPPGADAVRLLQDWATGRGPAPSFAPDGVRLLVANRVVRTLTPRAATDPGSWTLDVAYAERTEVAILDVLAAGPMHVRDVPPWACPVEGVALPPDLVRRLPWSGTLVTNRPRACLEVAAVQVWTDDERRITDVDVLLGSP